MIDERSEVRTVKATLATGICDWQAEGEDRAEMTIAGGELL